jgi:hypothetical protein
MYPFSSAGLDRLDHRITADIGVGLGKNGGKAAIFP